MIHPRSGLLEISSSGVIAATCRGGLSVWISESESSETTGELNGTEIAVSVQSSPIDAMTWVDSGCAEYGLVLSNLAGLKIVTRRRQSGDTTCGSWSVAQVDGGAISIYGLRVLVSGELVLRSRHGSDGSDGSRHGSDSSSVQLLDQKPLWGYTLSQGRADSALPDYHPTVLYEYIAMQRQDIAKFILKELAMSIQEFRLESGNEDLPVPYHRLIPSHLKLAALLALPKTSPKKSQASSLFSEPRDSVGLIQDRVDGGGDSSQLSFSWSDLALIGDSCGMSVEMNGSGPKLATASLTTHNPLRTGCLRGLSSLESLRLLSLGECILLMEENSDLEA